MALHEDFPHGLRLVRTIPAHRGEVMALACHPDGKRIVSASTDSSVRLWDIASGENIRTFEGHTQTVDCVGFTSGGDILVTGSWDQTLRIWSIATGNTLAVLRGHQGSIWQVTTIPEMSLAASASSDHTVRLWNVKSGGAAGELAGHSGAVYWVDALYSNGEHLLASSSSDGTVRIWDIESRAQVKVLCAESPIHCVRAHGQLVYTGGENGSIGIWDLRTGKQIGSLDRPEGTIKNIVLSPSGALLIAKSTDGTVTFWDTERRSLVDVLNEPFPGHLPAGMALSPDEKTFFSLGEAHTKIRVWELDEEVLLRRSKKLTIRSATVVFLGDSGSGKSALVNAMSGFGFVPTESTHGRALRRVQIERVAGQAGETELRELLLWDLAGQPAYRAIHQAYLPDATAAVLVFDPRSEAAPLEGIRYWASVIRQLRERKTSQGSLVTLLVAARSDVLNIRPSAQTLRTLQTEEGFDASFVTSAKSGEGMREMYAELCRLVRWEGLPAVPHTAELATAQAIVQDELRTGAAVLTIGPREKELLRAFDDLERLGSIRVLRRLNAVLLRPELLDQTAASIADAAMKRGGILIGSELAVLFEDERSPYRETALEDMAANDLAILGTKTEDRFLFPAFSLEPPPEDLGTRIRTFFFSGSTAHVYSTLIVRLGRMVGTNIIRLLAQAATVERGPSRAQFSIRAIAAGSEGGEIVVYRREGAAGAGAIAAEVAFLEAVSEDLGQLARAGSVRSLAPVRCEKCAWEPAPELERQLFGSRIGEIRCPTCGSMVAVNSVS